MKNQIEYYKLEIRFLRHFIALCESMIVGREEILHNLEDLKRENPGQRTSGLGRAKALTAERRSEIARMGAAARWGKR